MSGGFPVPRSLNHLGRKNNQRKFTCIGTYTGWGLRSFIPDEGCDAAGQQIDFAKIKAERLASGDPRPSIEERYPNHDTYVSAVTNAASQLQQQHLLLEEDL